MSIKRCCKNHKQSGKVHKIRPLIQLGFGLGLGKGVAIGLGLGY